MACPEFAGAPCGAPRRTGGRRLIINADDFGRSAEINAAVIRAHREGVLTTASLMVNEEGFDEAVTLARMHPTLGVGLHLTLVCGHSALPASRLPGLVDTRQRFTNCPVTAGTKYFFRRSLRDQLGAEIDAQFEKFRATGLPFDHVNGHLHFHLHPTILPLVLEKAARVGVRTIRLTSDPFRLNARIAGGRWLFRLLHAAVFTVLSSRARVLFKESGIRHTQRVFGLLQDARVDEQFVLHLLPNLPAGDSELYSHPSSTQFKHELDALLSSKVKRLISDLDIELVRYQDL
jgi:hopanoid biosynthesis associated protein HpnK